MFKIILQSIVLLFFLWSTALAKIDSPPTFDIPTIELLKDNPQGQSYYSIVRQKVQNKVYQLYARPDEGMVAVVLRLDQKGNVRKFRIIEDKTHATPYLRNLVRRSVKSIGRFPKFPESLSEFKELDFTINVSFKVEEEGDRINK